MGSAKGKSWTTNWTTPGELSALIRRTALIGRDTQTVVLHNSAELAGELGVLSIGQVGGSEADRSQEASEIAR